MSVMATTAGTKPNIMALLEDLGYRVTAPRRQVICLVDRKGDSFSAKEISSELPGVGRATVFRTIKLLLEAGAICKVALPSGAPMYSVARIEHHHHTVCVRCGSVGQFRDVMLERLMRSIGRRISGKIEGHRIEVYHTCQRCLAEQAT